MKNISKTLIVLFSSCFLFSSSLNIAKPQEEVPLVIQGEEEQPLGLGEELEARERKVNKNPFFFFHKKEEKGTAEELQMEEIYKREKEIRKAKYTKRYVEIVTNENDPIYIEDAAVQDSKTAFLKIKDVEFKYKVILKNQTPKIINSILIVWERGIPFTESLTISKPIKISKPMIPYERRTVHFNDNDSKRQGELYKVKVAKVIFEDGTQWRNPKLRENEL